MCNGWSAVSAFRESCRHEVGPYQEGVCAVALIKIRDLVKEYDGRKVLAGVNLDLCAGEVKVVMGPSGCGKTTLLRCLNRLVEPTSGV
ncbi:MAG: ATP-binding cassette domain-containing protein, partial [Methylophilaceae bacterium]